jgi:hypothetical protein
MQSKQAPLPTAIPEARRQPAEKSWIPPPGQMSSLNTG